MLDIKQGIRKQFEAALAQRHVFDFYGMERGGHHAIVQWLLACGPQPSGMVTRAATNKPGIRFYHPSGWYTTAIAGPKTVALSYGADVALPPTESRIATQRAVLCVRDVRNLLASRKRWGQSAGRPSPFRIDTLATHLWAMYAKQVLGDADYFEGRCVGICYDRWFISAEYRAKIIVQLNERFGWNMNVEAGEEQRMRVSMPGGGSSFDGAKFDGNAHTMKVLERWKAYANNPIIKKLLTPDVLELNVRLLAET